MREGKLDFSVFFLNLFSLTSFTNWCWKSIWWLWKSLFVLVLFFWKLLKLNTQTSLLQSLSPTSNSLSRHSNDISSAVLCGFASTLNFLILLLGYAESRLCLVFMKYAMFSYFTYSYSCLNSTIPMYFRNGSWMNIWWNKTLCFLLTLSHCFWVSSCHLRFK